MRTRHDRKGQTSHRPGSQGLSKTTAPGVPSVGRGICGQSTEIVDRPEGFPIPEDVLRRNNIFVFRVKGDGMRDDDVWDGDYVIVEQLRIPGEGDLVVAATEGKDPRLRRIRRDTCGIRLESVNPSNQAIVPEEKDVDIQGVVVGILRKYTG